ncbi:MAG: CocE/NonD family hydrolase, partial [Acidobacteria bacterium]|nr:CocE/NonD family hydrolase [Acidobacteriota bacterium]
MTTRRVSPLVLLGICASALAVAVAIDARQPAPAPDPAAAFTVRDEMIPMRDGVKLFTKIFMPKNQSGPLPFVFRRTPYGIDGAAGSFTRYYKALADEGYIFVFQDIRGKFKSEGNFVMQRPARAPGDTKSLDEGTDTYDTIEWLLKHVPQHN